MDLYIKPIKIYGKWLGLVGKWLGCIQPMCSAPARRTTRLARLNGMLAEPLTEA